MKNLLLWLVITVVLIMVFSNFGPKQPTAEKITYSAFLQDVDAGKITSVTIEDHNISATSTDKKSLATYMPMVDQNLLPKLMAKNIDVRGVPQEQQSLLMHIFINWFPMILLIAFWIFIMRQAQGGGKGGPMSFGRSKARLLTKEQTKITFADVAGVDEAKEEVGELVDFLKDPNKYKKLGGKVPCGVLLLGAPGTGKTLLAKAVAGEAKVPFYSISGSDFVEMFVGVGAARVRDLFDTAKKHAPCIIFIDEIDAVGRHRGAGIGGGHDEREHTLNQLLVEMDGFVGKEGVIVIAATNRPDVLDPALLRPGRFDRQVVVPLPDVRGREKILEVHMRKIPMAKSVNARTLARGTPGFSGADLANLVNEAALMAARVNKKIVGSEDFEKARDKILMGAERRSMVMSEAERKLTAYHEAGHAIVGLNVPDHDPIYKVSVIPRGFALGVTMFLPEEDRHNYSRMHLESKISGLFGGRIAEALIFGSDKITTGASNDIAKATELARNMVIKWGLSDKLGPLTYTEEEGEVFLGRAVTQHKTISDETASVIDQEIRAIVNRNYQRAEKILNDNLGTLHAMAEALIKYETLEELQIKEIMEGKEVTPPEAWQEMKREEKEKKEAQEKEKNAKEEEEHAEQHGKHRKKRKTKKTSAENELNELEEASRNEDKNSQDSHYEHSSAHESNHPEDVPSKKEEENK